MTKIANLSSAREVRWLCFIVATGILSRVLAIIVLNHTPESDELAYQSMALNLLNGNGLVDNMGNHAMYNVGYPLFVLAPVFKLFGGNILAALLLNALLGGLAIVLCYTIARETGAGRIGRLLAAAMWAFYLPASICVAYLMKENLMIPLMLGVVWCALRLTKEPAYLTGLVCGVLFGLLALTGSAALSLAAPVMLALAFAPAKVSRKLSLPLVILVSAVLVAAPWMLRNMQVLGVPVLNTNGGFNLYLGNNPAATGMFVSIADTPRGQTWENLREKGEVQASEILKREAVAWIREYPSEFLILAFKKAAYFWTPQFREGKGPSSRTETAVKTMRAIQFIVLVAGLITSLLFTGLRHRTMAVLWLAIVSYTAVHMLFYVIIRYREPIMPIVCVLAAFSFEYLFIRLKPAFHHAGAVIP